MSSSISAPSGAAVRGPSALALLDHLSDIVIVVDARGTLCYVNAACAELLGRPAADLLGMNALELVHPDDREMALDALTETVAKGPGVRDPLTVRVGVADAPATGDGMRLLELVANNLLDTPNVCGIVICARDVTGRGQPSTRHDALPTDADFSFDRAPSPCAVIGPDGRFTRVNPAMVTLTGHSAADLIGMRAVTLAHPDEIEHERTVSARLASGDIDTDTRERRLRRADGEWLWIRRTYWMLRNSDGSVRCINLALVDVTEQRTTQEHALQLRDILETSRELVFLTDSGGRIEYINPRARLLLGLNEGDQPQDRLEGFLAAETMARIPDQIVPVLMRDSVWTGELTMLPNRQLFQEMGEQALARADRDGTTVAVLFLDLDRFKHVNDSFGHPLGDELLVEVAARLRDSVRKGDALARFGGDEFAICCEHPAGQREMLELAQRLIAALSRPAQLGAAVAEVGVSIGIAIGAGSRVTIDALLRDADVALYQAKEQGRGRAVIFGTTAPADIGSV